ncbi:protein RISC-INTERACTING CLEARING 3'-5' EXORIBONUCLEASE 2 [Lycium barbarum]|uniref:protein RISC-INTERACTING CLEARING 3'-5' EXORIBONUCLEASE 2 n=1 Tax=Lycium barbarum TaxID=112863 RepID=UPI00293E3B69|nr:protein RISC-INTERACTING CLEARING 3'-5' EXORIBONUCLEASE 2 [Lycium barbarum]
MLELLTVGFDIKWRPTKSGCNSAALRWSSMPHLSTSLQPDSLVSFLRNPKYTFVGVGVKNDVEILEKDHGLSMVNVVDLRGLAAFKYGKTDLRNAGFKELCKVVLWEEYEKPKHIYYGKLG